MGADVGRLRSEDATFDGNEAAIPVTLILVIPLYFCTSGLNNMETLLRCMKRYLE